jgi:hypothetical protein
MDISRPVIEKAIHMVGVTLRNYTGPINEAFLRADDDLSVGLKLNFKPIRSGIRIKAEISFIASKVKDSIEDEIYPQTQMTIEFPRAEPGRPQTLCGTTEGARVRARWYRHR